MSKRELRSCDILSGEPAVARLVLVEARAGNTACRGGPAPLAGAGSRRCSASPTRSAISTARVVQIEVRDSDMASEEARRRMVARLGRVRKEAVARSDWPAESAMARLVIGALASLLASRVNREGAVALELMLGELIYVALAPSLGPSAASERARRATVTG